MKLTNETAFLGASVVYAKEKYFVVKINAKTVYLAKDKNFLKNWEAKSKGMTWKNFCSVNQAIMVAYNLVEIDEKEASLKESYIERDKEKASKKYLHISSEKILGELFKLAVDKAAGKKHKSFNHIIETPKDNFVVVADNVEAKMFLIHNLSGSAEFFFYDVDNRDYFPFSMANNKLGKEIIWPSIQIEQKQKVA